VSIVDLLSRAGSAGRATILMLALAAVLYVSPPALTAAGEQATAMIVAWRQPDMARELARAVARLDGVVDAVRKDAARVSEDRTAMEKLVSDASKRFDQGRDDDRAAIQVAFAQNDYLASLMSYVQLPIVLHDSLPKSAIATALPPAGTADRRPRVVTVFPERPERYARLR
jgi:hypothetical protein